MALYVGALAHKAIATELAGNLNTNGLTIVSNSSQSLSISVVVVNSVTLSVVASVVLQMNNRYFGLAALIFSY